MAYTGSGGYNYTNLAANADTLVKTGAGILRAIVINKKGATSNTCTIYDNTAASGTKIATFDTTVSFGTFVYDVRFTTGLEISIATGTACDVTVVWQ